MRKLNLNFVKKLGGVKLALAFCAALCVNEASATISLADTDEYIETDYQASGWTGEKYSIYGWVINPNNCSNTLSSGNSYYRLYSPAIELEEGNIYTFDFTIYNDDSRYPISVCEISLISDNSKNFNVIFSAPDVETSGNNMEVATSFEYTATKNETVYFSVYDVSPYSTGYKTGLKNFKITKELGEVVPNKVSGLTATPDPNGGKAVTLSWVNPTTLTNGEALEISKIIVSRDSEIIATLVDASSIATGASVSYTDNLEYSGVYTYSVTVEAADGSTSVPVKVTTPYVGQFEGLTVPYEYDPYDYIINSFWAIDTPEGNQSWTFNDKVIDVALSYLQPVDSYLFTPGFRFDPNKAYSVSFDATASNKSNVINLSFGITDSQETDVEPEYFIPLEPFSPAENNKAQQFKFEFSPGDAEGLKYFVWHATGEKQAQSYYNNTVTLNNIKVEEIPVLPTAATDVTAKAAEDKSLSATVNWTNPTKSTTGLSLSNLTADIERDGEIIAEGIATEGEKGEFVDNQNLTEGYHTYRVIIKNANGAAEPSEAGVSDYVGAALDIPFESDFANNPYVWNQIQPNEETANDKKWTIANGKATLTEDKGSTTDDILALPPLSLSNNIPYDITLNVTSGTYSSIPLKIVILDNESGDWKTLFEIASLSYNATNYTTRFAVEQEGDYILGAYACPGSAYSSFTITINSISVTEAPLTPGEAVNAKAYAEPEEEETVIVSWEMPTTTPEGVAISGDLTAEIFRGKTATGSAAYTATGTCGEAMEWEDDEAKEGINTYVIVISNDTDIKSSVTVESDYLAKSVSLPLTEDFTKQPESWTIHNYSSYSNGFVHNEDEACLSVEENSYSPINDWVVTPLVNFEPGNDYIIKVTASGYNTAYNGTITLEVHAAASNTSIDALLAGKKINYKEIKSETEELISTLADEEAEVTSVTLTTDKTPYTFIYSPAKDATADRKFIAMHFTASQSSYNGQQAALHSVEIQKDVTTGIEDLTFENGGLHYADGCVTADSEETAIYVYTVSGALVGVEKGVFQLEKLNAGIYIAKDSRNNTIKIIK